MTTELATVEKTLFDYLDVPEADRSWLQQQEETIRGFHRRALSDSLTIGTLLLAVRERIERRHFKGWLKARAGFSNRTAYRLMDIAKWFAPVAESLKANEDKIDICALHELSEQGVNPASRKEATELIQDGKPLTRDVAGVLIAKYKSEPKAKPTLFKECEEPPPLGTPDDSRIIATLQDLARNNGPVVLDATTDADDPDDVTYTAHFIGVPVASGRTLPEAVDRLTGHERKKACTQCGHQFPLSVFTVKKDHADGRASECRECSRKRVNAAKQDRKERETAA